MDRSKTGATATKTPALRVAVVGATGYTGGELLRLLVTHPRVTIAAVTSEQSAGKSLGEVFPSLARLVDQPLVAFDPEKIAARADLVFVALPSGSAMQAVASLVGLGRRVVDLSPDYRFVDPATYQRWYAVPHRYPTLLAKAVYGLPELHRRRIARARVVGNPGCYPTAALLALAPLVKKGLMRPGAAVIIDAKSGISGAGRGASLPYHFPEANEGLMAYKVGHHRHQPEISQELARLANVAPPVVFTPHLVPMTRGIFCTIYAETAAALTPERALAIYRGFYKDEPFVRVLEEGESPQTKAVWGSNYCDVGVAVDPEAKRVVLMSAIDNLVKGAAGQAIQNMNLMCGYPESLGLTAPPVFP
ncbi:MAG: N-acetyl-gamma-glutamyl-phosphate reductase [Nitrospirae bacterium]|nr:N-acetyl-gamma-glutamyl-phosphate reductase [Nitrospirota bacterium]